MPGRASSASKYIHCRQGVNLPEHAFITSCAAMPPKKAQSGESSPRAPLARLRSSRSLNSTSPPPGIPLASDSSSAACAASDGAGNSPCAARKVWSAWKPRCSCSGRSNLAKSDIRNSGSDSDCRSDLNVSIFFCLTWCMSPPLVYAPKPRVSPIVNCSSKG